MSYHKSNRLIVRTRLRSLQDAASLYLGSLHGCISEIPRPLCFTFSSEKEKKCSSNHNFCTFPSQGQSLFLGSCYESSSLRIISQALFSWVILYNKETISGSLALESGPATVLSLCCTNRIRSHLSPTVEKSIFVTSTT